MKNVALIFPGQGAQKVGMGLEFFQSSLQAKSIFEQADKICANGLTKVMFEGPEEKLTSTAYCQPTILTMSVAALKAPPLNSTAVGCTNVLPSTFTGAS